MQGATCVVINTRRSVLTGGLVAYTMESNTTVPDSGSSNALTWWNLQVQQQ